MQDYPKGYPLQAAFQASESSWSIYRGFNYLHARVILDLQDEIRCLEEDLEEFDLESQGTSRLTSRKDDLEYASSIGEEPSAREQLIEKIRQKLVNYGQFHISRQVFSLWSLTLFAIDELLIKARELNAFQRPSNRDYRSFRTWFWNIKPLSYEREEQFIKRREDLISLRHGREWSGFDGLIESCVRKVHCKLTQVQRNPSSLF